MIRRLPARKPWRSSRIAARCKKSLAVSSSTPRSREHRAAKVRRIPLRNIVETICSRFGILVTSWFIYSPEIGSEWDDHESIFARTWRTSMVARRRVHRIGSGREETLRDRIRDAERREQQQEIMLKDVHLLEAAIATTKMCPRWTRRFATYLGSIPTRSAYSARFVGSTQRSSKKPR
jgi:hypothetical protein